MSIKFSLSDLVDAIAGGVVKREERKWNFGSLSSSETTWEAKTPG